MTVMKDDSAHFLLNKKIVCYLFYIYGIQYFYAK